MEQEAKKDPVTEVGFKNAFPDVEDETDMKHMLKGISPYLKEVNERMDRNLSGLSETQNDLNADMKSGKK